ncbi:DUF4450 domain-containing protein [Sphingobacterium athyrii]|uniref:Glycogen debranching protein n=1 Tax=Sphingobacterium athyrii TaxID=2152717 RepID=A0A363NS73_9SPHI|nr:DUF4450 domain-containing protein [Sphingobacterium athyrii]PUV23608.1 glycogen debranching protein [Sphingobacterium athyrii]
MTRRSLILFCFLAGIVLQETAAQSKHWQHNDRVLHYTEDQGDFLLVNGRYRFNRALYGNNLASRVEAGDLPEFALYMPGMAGNLQFVLGNKQIRKKLINADHIETRYRPGAMHYRIKDALLGKGYIDIVVMAQADAEGMIVKLQGIDIGPEVQLYAVYGGASGKTFSRNGDIGADPESGFYLLPAYCENNRYTLEKNRFELSYQNKKNEPQFIQGSFSGLSTLWMSDATVLDDLSNLTKVKSTGSPILVGQYNLTKKPCYIQIAKGKLAAAKFSESSLVKAFEQAEQKRVSLASRVKINTPDRYINNLGAALAVAADGIWESPTFLHGAVAWRMRLNAWRGAYTANALGWHDRAKEHFSSYAKSQVIEPNTGPVVMDTTLHLARHLEKMGTSMFSNGYISRNPNNNKVPHHYDMNLVFIDQLLSHFNYTGDIAYLKQMWPTLTRHLHWEKRNFDRDNDGLYDAYCAIWASDGLQYSGGAVTHTSAYMYRANQMMVKLAQLIGADARPYQQEADKIKKALKDRLWLKEKGYFAEFQDALGNKLVHENPGLWTIYHAADAAMLDDFESYQNLQYVTNYLPKIPIRVKGQEQQDLYTLPTTTWQPYTWSINNVALAENLQTALAYWQAGRAEDAYQLWKSNLMESMYHGISPANFQQLSHYDAFRGELYRDFADPIGVASRTLVEGLFGVHPRLLDKQLFIKPGFPATWDFAQIELPEWSYAYKKEKAALTFQIKTRYAMPVKLTLEVPIDFTQVRAVKVNGKEVKWSLISSAINKPYVVIESEADRNFDVAILGEGKLEKIDTKNVEHAFTEPWSFPLGTHTTLLDCYDPQGMIQKRADDKFSFVQQERLGTFFVKLQQDDMVWWQAVDMRLLPPLKATIVKKQANYELVVENRSGQPQHLKIEHSNFQTTLNLKSKEIKELALPITIFSKGTNSLYLNGENYHQKVDYVDWTMHDNPSFLEQNLSSYYNARLTDIFQQKYLSPRPEGPTLQLPWQGIGNWCYPLTMANIDDSGIMERNKQDSLKYLGIPFKINSDTKNVVFVSQWDNYPTSVTIPLEGQASKMYLLVAGSTNPMQSQFVNAKIKVNYKDGTSDTLDLVNPINWWPIEQDYLDDNYAFEIPDERVPYRISLQSGALYKGGTWKHYTEIKGYSNRAIDGGAATLLDLPLNRKKKLQSLELIAVANDAVIGLISLTLMR